MRKRIISVILAVILAVSVATPAYAARVSAAEAVSALEGLGLVLGGDNGFDGERAPTRYEAVTMLVRLLGKETEAKSISGGTPFSDVTAWCEGYVSYAYANGLVNGVSAEAFAGERTAGAAECVTLVLRALGYDDGAGDFIWNESIVFADAIGLTHGEYSTGSEFLRNDLALLCYSALLQEVKGTGEKLIEKLYREGAVSYAALVRTRLASYVNSGKREYGPEEIYELASSAVFFLEVFDTEESYRKGESFSVSSGFFITDKGEAVVSYHAIDGAGYARVTTTDGRIYPVESVIYYDYYRDIAVVRVGRKAVDGSTVSRFPYLDMGDSDAISNGSPIYTVSNPNGLQDSFSGGYVSNKLRVLNDAEYPCIQISAPISTGSSGGPVINKHGEVIGVIYGTYTTGQNLNICVPINCIRGVELTGGGESLVTVRDRMNLLKEKAVITASMTEVVLEQGEEMTLTIESDYPGAFGLQYHVVNRDIVSCQWGRFNTCRTIPITLTGGTPGQTQVIIQFHDLAADNDANVIITVTVV